MKCQCDAEGVLRDNEAAVFIQKYLETIKVDNANWKILYKCKACNIFWEETSEEARWVDIPVLRKVDDDYVKRNWNLAEGS